jgi:hypothetical protein
LLSALSSGKTLLTLIYFPATMPYRQCVVPPPLCAVTLGFPAAIQCAALLACGPSGGREAAAALLVDGTLAVAWSVEEDLWEETAEEEGDEARAAEDVSLALR